MADLFAAASTRREKDDLLSLVNHLGCDISLHELNEAAKEPLGIAALWIEDDQITAITRGIIQALVSRKTSKNERKTNE